MADESSNWANPDEADNLTPFERFERLTKHLVGIPKTELDARRKQVKRRAKRRIPAK